MTFNELQEVVKSLALKAIEFDRNGQANEAVFFYLEASQALVDFKQASDAYGELNNSQRGALDAKLHEYLSRAETLKTHLLEMKNQQQTANSHKSSVPRIKTELEKDIDKGSCMIGEALDEDADGNLEEALELYTNSVEFYLKIVSSYLFF